MGSVSSNKEEKAMHKRVANTLRDRIARGIYRSDVMLPTEISLSAEFDVSRHTMREALKALVIEGLIERSPGRGTVISTQSVLSTTWGIKSLEELIGEFVASDVNVLYKGTVHAKQFPLAAKVFSLRKNASMFLLRRVLGNEKGPAVVNTLCTLLKYSQKIPPELIGARPLIAQIEEYCQVHPARARQVASAIASDSTFAELLDVDIGTPLLHLRRTYLGQDGRPLEHTELVCRPDRYQQSVDFMRESNRTRGKVLKS
jgi:GntR family transcriptional regulator